MRWMYIDPLCFASIKVKINIIDKYGHGYRWHVKILMKSTSSGA